MRYFSTASSISAHQRPVDLTRTVSLNSELFSKKPSASFGWLLDSRQLGMLFSKSNVSYFTYNRVDIRKSLAPSARTFSQFFYYTVLANARSYSFGTPFHVVNVSPMPLFTSIAFGLGAWCLVNALRGVYLPEVSFGIFTQAHIVCLVLLASVIYAWLKDVSLEEYQGCHTVEVQRGFRFGIVLFILSEAMLFGSFFWGYFHVSLNPGIWIGSMWPPQGLPGLYMWRIPAVNTILLLVSSATVTVAHMRILRADRFAVLRFWSGFLRKSTMDARSFNSIFTPALTYNAYSATNTFPYAYMVDTIVRGFLFLGFQTLEYVEMAFTISDSVFGSIFFSLTGLHGFHVFVGLIGLLSAVAVSAAEPGAPYSNNLRSEAFTNTSIHVVTRHRVALDGAVWYWHFVDVIWLGVMLFLYFWGSSCYQDFFMGMGMYEYVYYAYTYLYPAFVKSYLSLVNLMCVFNCGEVLPH